MTAQRKKDCHTITTNVKSALQTSRKLSTEQSCRATQHPQQALYLDDAFTLARTGQLLQRPFLDTLTSSWSSMKDCMKELEIL